MQLRCHLVNEYEIMAAKQSCVDLKKHISASLVGDCHQNARRSDHDSSIPVQNFEISAISVQQF